MQQDLRQLHKQLEGGKEARLWSWGFSGAWGPATGLVILPFLHLQNNYSDGDIWGCIQNGTRKLELF